MSNRKTVSSVDDGGEKKKVKAIVITMADDAKQKEAVISQADPWEALYAANQAIEPPFDLRTLATFGEQNSELGPCIEAMEVNICGYGYRIMLPGHDETQDAKEVDEEVLAERELFTAFLQYGAYDSASFTATRRKLRRDIESTGNGYLELLVGADGVIGGYNHIPSHQIRLAPIDAELTLYKEAMVIGEGDRRRIVQKDKAKRFRRFLQINRFGRSSRQVWFKEFGDPRVISGTTGRVITGMPAKGERIANPILHFKIYNTHTPYGLPRYVGNILSILGGRAAEEINYQTFKNNNVPSMMLMVSNGRLTQGTIDRIKTFVDTSIKGKDNYSKFLILEADSDSEDGGQVKIDVKPMSDTQRDDAMFQKYEQNNAGKVRRSFRLPPIFVGAIDGYDRSTADTSRKFGDEQVFAPERDEEDFMWNRLLISMGMKHHVFRSNSPNVTDDGDIIAVMSAAERSGAMTPRRAQNLLEDILGRKVFKLDPSVNQDVPFSQTMAQAVQNKAKPNEVGQQVTALKAKYIRELVLKEKAASQNAIPAIRLAEAETSQVLSGVMRIITTVEKNDDLPGMVVLVDSQHALGMVEIGDRMPSKSKKGSYEYPILQVTEFDPCNYVSIFDAGGTFVEGIVLQ